MLEDVIFLDVYDGGTENQGKVLVSCKNLCTGSHLESLCSGERFAVLSRETDNIGRALPRG